MTAPRRGARRHNKDFSSKFDTGRAKKLSQLMNKGMFTIRDAMHWPETRQDMDMILNTADNLRHPVHAFDDPTEVRMKTWLPFGLNEGSPLFGREDEVKVQAEEG